ncbi:MAG: phage antirepressor [Lachnospiraceae bacterium]|nr:phage antirepressor [Lachnospiraceae bacterium]
MNELQIFENSEFGSVRTIIINDEPWFVASDIAKALGYRMASDLTRRIEDEDKGTQLMSTPSGEQNMTIINESGLYEAVMGSKIPSAKKFKRWVTSEVLPSIRKHGMYAEDELLDNPDLLISVAQKLKEERERNKRLEKEKQALEQETIAMDKKISELTPKANYVDIILQSTSTVLTTQIAQDYGMSAKAFNKKLSEFRIQRKVGGQWILYAEYQGKGYVHSKTIDIVRSNGQPDVRMQTEWTQKGRLFLYEELKNHGIYPMIEKAA